MVSKKITGIFKLIITVSVWFMFAFVWMNYYNNRAFRSHRSSGYVGTLIVWVIIYLWICSIFKSFSLASSSVSDSVISQVICIGMTDLSAFVAVCLLSRGWVNVLPGLGCYIVQICTAAVLVGIAKRALINNIVPSRTLVVYGGNYTKDSVMLFVERLLEKYSHLFDIRDIVEADYDEISDKIGENERIVLAGVEYERRKELAKMCIDENKIFYYIPEVEEIVFQSCSIKNLLDTPLERYNYIELTDFYDVVKRILDCVFAVLFLILLSPIMVVVALAIKIEDGGPVLYRQLRVTDGERRFYILKFRSMIVDAESNGAEPAKDNDSRITKVGAICRKIRIDELPQLVNIIKGDMSFVGPRPERVEHVENYEKMVPEFKYRHAVKGGLTGYAQVYGRYNTSPEDKLKLDLIYIMNRSLYMDFRLVLLTIRTLFQSESTQGFSDKQIADVEKR